MSFPKINPTHTRAWQKLTAHFSDIKNLNIADEFKNDSSRAVKMKTEWENFYLDYSKNKISDETLQLLIELAEEVQLREAIDLQFSGAKINGTENRAVMHTALRDFEQMPSEVKSTLEKMREFSGSIINGDWKGYTGKKITDVVNIGIGGSDLGPAMVTEALSYYKTPLNIHYLSNIDGDHVQETLKKLERETTLFIVVSKSFTTKETLTNASTVKNWFLKKATKQDIEKHFVAVSTNCEQAEGFGISSENIFPMWDWVGGRFSLWSAVGLSVCCAVGYQNFESLLQGAHKMDKHFKEVPFKNNIPVLLALLSIWYNNFFETQSEAIVPYSQYLSKLVPYLQQASMESNGKSVDRNGNTIDYQTGMLIWGSTGTNGQHAYFQLLHQGTKMVPVEFIAFAKALHNQDIHQEMLLANCLAQSETLLNGTQGEQIEDPYKVFDGNKPSTTLLIKQLTPENLGALIAAYEHKIFVQGVIWNIYSYDQWGVELGKTVAENTINAIQKKDITRIENASTKELLKVFIKS